MKGTYHKTLLNTFIMDPLTVAIRCSRPLTHSGLSLEHDPSQRLHKSYGKVKTWMIIGLVSLVLLIVIIIFILAKCSNKRQRTAQPSDATHQGLWVSMSFRNISPHLLSYIIEETLASSR